jgi:hypothetical protein
VAVCVNRIGTIKLAAEAKWAAYNQKMRELFAERDAQPMDSPKRDAAVEKIMALWVAEG